MRAPALLAILDGVGIAPASPTNALSAANAGFLHELFSGSRWPCCSLRASGLDVGLPDGQMGNSEVGHLNIGAGRVVNQELTRIDASIADGSILENQALIQAFDATAAADSCLHFFGLHSDGGVHSMLSHLQAMMKMAADRGVGRIRIAAFLDGRDVSPTSGAAFLGQTVEFCRRLEDSHPGLDVRFSMVCGRYFAMDRDNRWQRVERAWRSLVLPTAADVMAVPPDTDPVALVQDCYQAGVTDEFVEPVAFGSDGIADGDSVVFFNFRPDRARELTRAFIDPGFAGFERPLRPDVNYVCMTEYDASFERDFRTTVAFPKSFPENVLADYLSSLGLRQLHIAETEKYAHVTFFLNGGIEQAKPGERRILIPSPKVATYDLQPQMSAPEVTDALVSAIENDEADVYIVNYANGDMVGHTGVLPAAIAAVEAVDAGLKRVVEAIVAKGGVALVTADHGNCEQMVDDSGAAWTAHTTSEVPLVAIDGLDGQAIGLRSDQPARLADIAPTLMDLMGLEVPAQWTGRSLLQRSK
jgi:2,3-bisphosphoglycerate-independent phosphoglycerate mutase